MTKVREELQIGLIYKLLKKQGYYLPIGEEDDVLHDIYCDCLEYEYYARGKTIASFVEMKIRNYFYEKMNKNTLDVTYVEKMTENPYDIDFTDYIALERAIPNIPLELELNLKGLGLEQIGEMMYVSRETIRKRIIEWREQYV